MKKKFSILLTLLIVLATVFGGCAKSNVELPISECLIPPSFESEEKMVEYISTIKAKPSKMRTAIEQSEAERYSIDKIDFFYRYPYVPDNLTFCSLKVNERNILYSYDFEEKEFDGYFDFVFRWDRVEDGATYLSNELSCNPMNCLEGYDNVYYSDIRDGREYYFLFDGYLFFMFMTDAAFDNLVAQGVDIFSATKVMLE